MTITKDNIRRILISKGRLLVKEKGADYLTARKLAEASAYSVGTIYNQFGTMDNFVLEQNKQTLDELVRYMLKTPERRKLISNAEPLSGCFCRVCAGESKSVVPVV